MHLIPFLNLPKAVDGLTDEPLGVAHAPANRHNIVMSEGSNGLIGVDGVELGKDLPELLVLLREGALL